MGEKAELAVVGDVFINKENPATVNRHVKEELADADLLIGNLEAPISDRGEKVPFAAPWLRADRSSIEGLEETGFDILTLANNHMMDFGVESMLDTVSMVNEIGVETTGTGESISKAGEAAHVREHGQNIAVIGIDATPQTAHQFARAQCDSPGINALDISPHYPDTHVEERDVERMGNQIEEASEKSDFLIAYIHFGIGATRTVSQKYIAEKSIEAGADCVVGTNSHELQGIETYQSSPIFYGISHFFWDPLSELYSDIKEFSNETCIVKLVIDDGRLQEAKLRPGYITDDNYPKMLSTESEEYTRIVNKVMDLSKRDGLTPEIDPPHITIPDEEMNNPSDDR